MESKEEWVGREEGGQGSSGLASLKAGRQSKGTGRKKGVLVGKKGRMGTQAARQARRAKDELVIGGTGRSDQGERKDTARRLLFYYY